MKAKEIGTKGHRPHPPPCLNYGEKGSLEYLSVVPDSKSRRNRDQDGPGPVPGLARHLGMLDETKYQSFLLQLVEN